MTAPHARRRAARLGAVGFALAVHLAVLLAVLVSWRTAAPSTSPPAVDLDLPAPFPRVRPAVADAHRAGGSPASAPRLAAPSTPQPQPSLAPPARLQPPPPAEATPLPAPALLAPAGPVLASPVTGAGAGAATGGDGAGVGTGPGGPGGPALADPDWLAWFTPEQVERAYPQAAYRAGAPGSALLACTGRKDGRLQDCRVVGETPAGQGFGRAALSLARFCRFRPLKVDGRPVEAVLRIPIDFAVDG